GAGHRADRDRAARGRGGGRLPGPDGDAVDAVGAGLPVAGFSGGGTSGARDTGQRAARVTVAGVPALRGVAGITGPEVSDQPVAGRPGRGTAGLPAADAHAGARAFAGTRAGPDGDPTPARRDAADPAF